MTAPLDLDDADALRTGDPDGMLLAVAGSAAQVREAAVLSAEAGVARLADGGRPRTVVVLGTGVNGTAGDVLAALAGPACPVPVLVLRGAVLPRWVGAADLVLAVSCTGRDPETLAAVEEAVRRGCPLLAVGAAGSPLEALAHRGRGVVVPVGPGVPGGRPVRAALWSLCVPLLVAADALGLLAAGPEVLEEAAAVLEDVATRCRPAADSLVNPGKALAVELVDALPVVWAASPLAGVAAQRFAAQLAGNAGVPACWGVLPDAGHAQVGVLDGPWVGGDDDLFRDRADEPERPVLRLVLLREPGEAAPDALCADVCADLARTRGVGVSALLAEGRSPLARLASLVCVTDFASTYLALSTGADPTPTPAADALTQRTSR